MRLPDHTRLQRADYAVIRSCAYDKVQEQQVDVACRVLLITA